MSTAQVTEILYYMFQLMLRLALPFLLVSMVVGIVIAIFQAATQINEQTLAFLPKFLAIVALLGMMGSSMLASLQEFFIQMTEYIAGGR